MSDDSCGLRDPLQKRFFAAPLFVASASLTCLFSFFVLRYFVLVVIPTSIALSRAVLCDYLRITTYLVKQRGKMLFYDEL